MSLFEDKGLKPMLLGENNAPFDAPDWIYELKADGYRCIAYLDPLLKTDLRNKRDMALAAAFPELAGLCRQVKHRCILDGELVVTDARGAPDFYGLQSRAGMSDITKIRLAAARRPATYLAFDILFLGNEAINFRPLMERKALLDDTVMEGGRLAVSRFIEQRGTALYKLAEAQGLEGVVAKRKDSKYFFGRTTKDWLKIKHLPDDDFVVAGYIRKDKGATSLVLGQYGADGRLQYRGHVTWGVSGRVLATIRAQAKRRESPFQPLPPGNDRAVWIEPLVGIVNYMPSDKTSLRQPVFKGFRDDKLPEECIAFTC